MNTSTTDISPNASAQTILVTGGAGYIGSHTVVALQNAGYKVLIIDNFSNSKPAVLERIARITGNKAACIQGDIRDIDLLRRVFHAHAIDAVIHFAGLKAVGESVQQPLAYYDNNVIGSLRLMQVMQEVGVNTLVFSSSATVYGDPDSVPIREDAALRTTNPYGTSKLHIEDMLRDWYRAKPELRIALLRYFNPVGAHPSGLIGEDPSDIPNNLMPYIAQVAVGKRECLHVFGNDYPTPDGTGVRDYIHVLDLADGHLAALQALQQSDDLITVNLGTGQGYSVLEVVEAFARACGKTIAHEITARRDGDIACCYADPTYAKSRLGWQAVHTLDAMCRDHWRWQKNNPDGYPDADTACES